MQRCDDKASIISSSRPDFIKIEPIILVKLILVVKKQLLDNLTNSAALGLSTRICGLTQPDWKF